jgi:hypothetical protein
MNLLQAIFILSGFVIFIAAFDISRRQKFNALHFLVFLWVGLWLFIFTIFPGALDLIGQIFGLPRGADVLVYVGIIFLMYFTLLLLSKTERNKEDITRLIREVALLQSQLNGGEAGGWETQKSMLRKWAK